MTEIELLQAITNADATGDVKAAQQARLRYEAWKQGDDVSPQTLDPSPRQEDSPSMARGIARSLGEGAFLGFGDELAGLTVTLAAKATGDKRPAMEIYNEVVGAEREGQSQFREENPKTALAANVLGGLTTLKPGLSLLKAAYVPTTGAKGALGSGAVYGGAVGAGVADPPTPADTETPVADLGQSVVERLPTAALGAAAGAGAGLGMYGGMQLVLSGAPAIWRTVAPDARAHLMRLARDSGLTPYQIAERLNLLGAKATLADVSGVFQQVADQAASRLGPAARKVKDLIRRDEGSFGRIMEPIRRIMGDRDKAVKTIKELKDTRFNAASPLYEKAYKEGITNTPTLLAHMKRPAVKRAWDAAKISARNDPDNQKKIFAGWDQKQPSLRGWQGIVKSLWDQASTKRNAGASGEAADILKLRRAILQELDDQSPTYKEARSIWASTSHTNDVIELGRKFMKTTPAEVREIMADLTEGDKVFYRMGMGRAVEEKIATITDTNDLTRIFRNEAFREKARDVFPDTESYVDFINTIVKEVAFKSTSRTVGKGSQTHPRQVVEKQLGAAPLEKVGDQATTLLSMIRKGLSAAGAKLTGREATIQDLGRLVLAQDKPTQIQAIRMMDPGGRGPGNIPLLPSLASANLAAQRQRPDRTTTY